MSDEPKYQPGDYVRLRTGRSTESQNHLVAELSERYITRSQPLWATNNFLWSSNAHGIWEDEIVCKISEEEYEKSRLMRALE